MLGTGRLGLGGIIVCLRSEVQVDILIPQQFHIPRTLQVGEGKTSEAALLADPGLVIVLAEPGAGKTGLLDSVAHRLGSTRVRASTVRPAPGDTTLIVDAFDEVARIGDARVHDILDRMRDVGPDRVLISSRSSEWEEARTRFVGELFRREPLVVRLVPLDDGEQRQLFEHWHPDRSFDAFHADIQRFDLHHLLGNPEFLRLFAGAHDEADGRLPSRGEVFTLAIRNLAEESNRDVMVGGAPTREKRIEWANEVFAKLLLSGADGVAMGDLAEDSVHPQFQTIGLEGDGPPFILGTRLFRPGAEANRHEPVHRIVAEYGAARHLVRLIDTPSRRLTIAQCLALIAPNGAARDDLRGLLGWMAALGSQAVQDAVIALDPYAVLSNGDPAGLTVVSRVRLLDALGRLNADDPYFRRGDVWRSFSAFGFFTTDIADAVRPIISASEEGQLKGLVLELLIGSPAAAILQPELRAILLDESARIGLRLDALYCLLGTDSFEPVEVLRPLVESGTADALRLAAEILIHIGDEAPPYDLLREMLKAATKLYPPGRHDRSRVIGERYFLKPLIQQIDREKTIRLLDDLTVNLRCTCGEKTYECYCREGISKIVGLLLDAYFERAAGPHDPNRVWGWVRNLHFHGRRGVEHSPAVVAIQADDNLRRALHRRAFGKLSSREDIFEIFFDTIGHHGHSGLHQKTGDARALIDFAYDTNNSALWIFFAPFHHYYGKSEERGPDGLRHYCREQARENPELMREWARMNRGGKESWKGNRPRRFRIQERRRRKEQRVTEAKTVFFHQNRAAVERGDNVNWTHDTARSYLHFPDRLPVVTHGLFDPEAVLRSSLVTLGDRCPSIEQIGEGGQRVWTTIFLAGAVAEFRATGTLEAVSPAILRVILPDTDFKVLEEGERDVFLKEVRRHGDLKLDEAEAYARAYFEPSLAAGYEHHSFYILHREPVLNPLRASLPLEWLRRFPDLPIHTLGSLFDMAAGHGDRADLLALIRERCVTLDEGMLPHPREAQRLFWFLRDFWFAEDVDASVWNFMARDRNMVLSFENRRYRGRAGDEIWTPLSALKIERILRTYLPEWPVVPLPSSWGTGSPKGETAYRYLRDVVWQIGRGAPAIALPVVERLLADEITAPSHDDLRSIRADLRRKAALASARPGPIEIAAALHGGPPASVEQIRALVVELLEELQKDVRAGDTGMIHQFYNGGARLGEVAAMYPISAWLQPRLAALDVHEVVEHHLGDHNRCDLTTTRMIGGRPHMLVIEGKGQWHRDLFTAATMQLADRYAMHPNADEQGIFLVLWYGTDEEVAGLKRHDYASAIELRKALEERLSEELRGRLNIVVLDVSR